MSERLDSEPAAVLCSGGLDSAVLLAALAERGTVLPIYVRVGLAWESEEAASLDRLLRAAPFAGRVGPLVHLELNVRDVYPESHWAVCGSPPAYDTPDADVYLPGRNVLLLSKAALLCAARGIRYLAIGSLLHNPFPDATPEFLKAMAQALSLGLAHAIRIDAPFATLQKPAVVSLGDRLGVPLHLTLSCMKPEEGIHCGLCSKCRERRDAFAEAGVRDDTVYRAPSPRGRTEGV
jgi:7-cyano-7-deazaguanine synthase